jgi:hypothetical protein
VKREAICGIVRQRFAKNQSRPPRYRVRGYAGFFHHLPLLLGMSGYEFFVQRRILYTGNIANYAVSGKKKHT